MEEASWPIPLSEGCAATTRFLPSGLARYSAPSASARASLDLDVDGNWDFEIVRAVAEIGLVGV
jgi:hypothetical protein